MSGEQDQHLHPSESGGKPADGRNRHADPMPLHEEHGREKEIGGRDGPDPTRYGDWEKAGRCIDF